MMSIFDQDMKGSLRWKTLFDDQEVKNSQTVLKN